MVYSLLETPDGMRQSARLVVASIVIAAAALAAANGSNVAGNGG